MKINGSSAENIVQNAGRETKGNSSESLQGLVKGQVIEGIVREVSDKITIDFSGRELKFPKDAIQNAKEGDIRKFKIMEVSGNSIVLKEMGSTGKEDINPILSTRVETDRLILSENIKTEDDSKEDLSESGDAAGRMTLEDYYAISQESLPIEEYNMERLERVISRIKCQKALKEDTVQKLRVKIKERRESDKKAGADALASGSGIKGLIVQKLTEADLPVTEDNVKKIEQALLMAESIRPVSDNAKAYLIGNELPPTISNLYKAEHSGGKKISGISDNAWNQLIEPAGRVIESAGREVNEETLKEARWLLDNRLPLTKESLEYKQALDNLQGEGYVDAFMEQAAAAAGRGLPPEEADVTLPGRNEISELVNDWNTVSYKELLKAVRAAGGSKVSLRDIKALRDLVDTEAGRLKGTADAASGRKNGFNLVESEDKLNAVQSDGSTDIMDGRLTDEALSSAGLSIQEITAKRQLEEIRLKLSVESGMRLSMKGIHIDTDSIEKIIKGLKELEDAYYKSLMQEADKTAGDDEVQMLKEASIELEELKNSPVQLLALTFSRRDVITVKSLALEGTALKADMENTGRAYETVMTVPRKDLGDSIQKAFRNIDDILDSLNLEAVQANQRAVRILSYNSMELTYENIEQMKQYDAKVNDMLNSMKPAVTAELIKRGIDPLSLTVDELREQAEAARTGLTIDEDEKYSEFLYRMDKQGGMTEEQRNAYIGIYRLIHQVNKTDGAAIGSVIKSGRELTLSNLLTAVRTIRKSGIDKRIDNGFGCLERLNKKGESITEQIHSGVATEEYAKMVLKKAEEDISPEKLHEIAESGNIAEMSMEQLAEQLAEKEDAPEEALRYQEKLERLNDILTDSRRAAGFLKSMGIQDSASMIEAAKSMLEGGTAAYDEIIKAVKGSRAGKVSSMEENNQDMDAEGSKDILEGFFKDAVESMEDKNELEKTYKEYLEIISGQLEAGKEAQDIDSSQIDLLRKIGRSIRLMGELAEKECYEIPVITDQGIASMNVTIIHGANESRGLKIGLENVHGILNIDMSMTKDRADLSIYAENAAGLDEARSREDIIKEAAEKSGIMLERVKYSLKPGAEAALFRYDAASTPKLDQELKTIDIQTADETKLSGSAGAEALYKIAKAMVKAYLNL